MDGKLSNILFSTGGAKGEAVRQRIRDVVSRHVGNFTLFEGRGFWEDREESSYQLLVVASDSAVVEALIGDLRAEFQQESILEVCHAAADVILHSGAG